MSYAKTLVGLMVLSTMIGAADARADQDPTPMPTPIPIIPRSESKPLADFLSAYVYKVTTPRLVYHWFDGSDKALDRSSRWKKGRWTQKLSATDYDAYSYVSGMATRYFNYNGNDPAESGEMFGPGLYAALDPVATMSYGGSTGTWVLVQLRLNPGFTILDVARDGGNTAPLNSAAMGALSKMECPVNWNYTSSLIQHMMNPATQTNQKCLKNIQAVIHDQLAIDGFFYGYSSRDFTECDPAPTPGQRYHVANPLRAGAFVITDAKNFKPADIRAFNATTDDDLDDRLEIESSFYRADFDNPNPSVEFNLAEVYKANPKYNGWKIRPNSQRWGYFPAPNQNLYGVNSVTLCDPSQPLPSPAPFLAANATPAPIPSYCVTLAVTPPPPPAYPTTMSNSMPPISTVASAPGCKPNAACTTKLLLWPDLEGKQTTSDVSSWIKTNFWGCSNKPDYDLPSAISDSGDSGDASNE